MPQGLLIDPILGSSITTSALSQEAANVANRAKESSARLGSRLVSPAAGSGGRRASLVNAIMLRGGELIFDPNTPQSQSTRNKEFPLYDYAHIPAWMQGNPYVQSYYRCGYSTLKCFKSIFAWHNETINIWSHLVGFLVALVLAAHVMLHMNLGRKRDYFVFSLLELGSLAMLGGSCVYHTLAAHYSATVHNCALSFDYYGISLMIVGSFYPPVFYLFSCNKSIRFTYFTIVTALGAVSILGPLLSARFHSQRFATVRLVLFCSMAVVGGLMPGVQMYLSLPANDATIPVYRGLFTCLMIYGAGMALYLLKFPECWFPGKFDLLLSSHQLWHYFVICAAVVTYFTSISAFQLWRITGAAGGECV